MLGKLKDRIVAKKLGVKVWVVRWKRTQLKIPPHYDRRWTKRWLKLLGTMPDTHVAKIIGIHWKAVTRKRRSLGIPARWLVRHRWTSKELRRLGTMPDAELARRMGVSVTAVKVKRVSIYPNLYEVSEPHLLRVLWVSEPEQFVTVPSTPSAN